MMDWLKNFAANAQKELQAQVARFQNREFLEATVAGCALVAAADGNISSDEKQKMMGFMELSPELKVFHANDVVTAFKRNADLLSFDFQIGKMDALKTIGKLAHNTDAARVMVRVCCLIGAADGNFDDDEKRAVVEICNTLQIDPKEFGLTATK